MTGDVQMRGEQVLIQSQPQPRQRPSSQIMTEDAHAAADKRGRKLSKEKKLGAFSDFGRT